MTSDNNGPSRVERRSFLKMTGGVATVGGLAGCSGGDGSGDDEGQDGGGQESNPESTPTEETQTTTQGPDYPEKEITFIVPYGPGGGYDFYTRALAKVLTEEDIVPVQVKVQNIEGAGGITATNQVYNAEPDGYTLMIINPEAFALGQLGRPQAAKYDLSKMTILPRVAGTTRALAVSTQTDITSGDELLQAAANGEIKWTSEGPTTTQSVMVKALAAVGGTDFTVEDYRNNVVSFDGRESQYTAMKRGDVHVMSGDIVTLNKYVKTGDLRFVFTYSKEDSCPDLVDNDECDTFATLETDVQNADQIIAISGGPFHRVFGGPPEISSPIHKYLCGKISTAIKSDAFAKLAEEAGRPISYANCERSEKGVKQVVQTYKDNKDVLKEIGLL